MEDELLIKLLSNIGVPAAICFYTLFGVNKTLRELTAAINKLTNDVDSREQEQTVKIEKLENKIHELTFRLDSLKKGA